MHATVAPPTRDDDDDDPRWDHDATAALIDAWARLRGPTCLRRRHWRKVADAVNGRHPRVASAAVQPGECRSRVEDLKRKYRTEKSRAVDSNGECQSRWPFFSVLDAIFSKEIPAVPNHAMGLAGVAEAIERLREVYERVEAKKRRQMVELEKQRMEFAKELESHRMQLFVNTQLHALRVQRQAARRSGKLPSEKKGDAAFLHFGASWNLLSTKCYPFCCELDGDLNL